ncbi:MAG: mersacidin/lichenicidin family type 2 lantibiotic [Candidatus Limnocylindria bacterium]
MDTPTAIVLRAWKDESFRNSLTEEQRAAIPPKPENRRMDDQHFSTSPAPRPARRSTTSPTTSTRPDHARTSGPITGIPTRPNRPRATRAAQPGRASVRAWRSSTWSGTWARGRRRAWRQALVGHTPTRERSMAAAIRHLERRTRRHLPTCAGSRRHRYSARQ